MYRIDNAFVNITTSCNIYCSHCFINAGKAQHKELSTLSVLSLLSELSDLGTNKLTLTGGEPLLRQDIREIIKYASTLKKQGIRKISLVTNGMLLTEELADIIARHINRVNISIDGFEKEHDALRGKGSYQKAIEGLRLLVQSGAKPTVFITITKSNVNSLQQLVKYLNLQEGVKRFRARNLWLLGRAKEHPDLKAEQNEIERTLMEIGIKSDNMHSNDQDGKALGYNVNVHPNGNIYPCHFLQTDNFIAGNIIEQPLKDIYLNSQLFNLLRSLDITCCQNIPDARTFLAGQLSN